MTEHPMRVAIGYGRDRLEVDVAEQNLVAVHRQPRTPPLTDIPRAVHEALEKPLGFPALRHALTPDDHVAVVVDEQLPHPATFLTPVLEHITQAHVPPQAITLLCPATSAAQPWVDDLPEVFEEVRLEVHDPTDRRHLSYLATTRKGRRIYLNRTVVDADQSVILTRRGYDPLLGYSGGAGALYPAMSDEATLKEMSEHLSLGPPGETPSALQREAAEVAWLLGAPFLVQVIEGEDSNVVHVLGGPVENSGEGQRLLDARWRVEVDRRADLVVAGVGGDPERHQFVDIARAFSCAARVVKPQGRVVLLSSARPNLGPSAGYMRQVEDAESALGLFRQHKPADMEAGFLWASAARHAHLYLLSGLADETAEELFTTPLEHAGQVERLIRGAGSCLFLEDAHKTMAVVHADAFVQK
jgi:nickel-dependent lactate racemase